MSLEDDIIAGMREGYNKTNLRDLNLEQYDDAVRRTGIIMQGAPNKHEFWNITGFDPVQLMFLRKMVSLPILEKKLRTIKEDYLKAVVYGEFYTKFIIDGEEILDKMTQRVRQLERIDPFLDPDLGLFVRSCALDYMANYRPIARRDRRKEQYNRRNTEVFAEYTPFRRIDPLFEAAGSLLYEQFQSDKIKERLSYVTKINDLAALTFIDINLSIYKEQVREGSYQRFETEILGMIEQEDYLKAAHKTMDKVAKSVTRAPLAEYISSMEPTTY